MFKFDWKMNKEKALLLLLFAGVLLVLAVPDRKTQKPAEPAKSNLAASSSAEYTYEQQLESRVKKILKNVDGVGAVDVMIVLKTSEEKVLHVDKNTSNSTTQEQDQEGGTRKAESWESAENTVMSGSGDSQPVVEKEIKPEIEGIIISASGGDSPTVKAEISAAMEALFGLPPHKIKVLKRVE